jgi:hypothetical protein
MKHCYFPGMYAMDEAFPPSLKNALTTTISVEIRGMHLPPMLLNCHSQYRVAALPPINTSFRIATFAPVE